MGQARPRRACHRVGVQLAGWLLHRPDAGRWRGHDVGGSDEEVFEGETMSLKKQADLSVHQSKLDQTVVPLLTGRVFHVTKLSSLLDILERGILHNQSGDLHSPFGYSNRYFKCRGCVSFFDFRRDDAEDKAMKCHPLKVGGETNFAILYLSTASYSLLRDGLNGKRKRLTGTKLFLTLKPGVPATYRSQRLKKFRPSIFMGGRS